MKTKNNLAFDTHQMVIENIKSSKVFKYALIVSAVAIGTLALGYGAKILNFTVSNLKVLNNTIKQK